MNNARICLRHVPPSRSLPSCRDSPHDPSGSVREDPCPEAALDEPPIAGEHHTRGVVSRPHRPRPDDIGGHERAGDGARAGPRSRWSRPPRGRDPGSRTRWTACRARWRCWIQGCWEAGCRGAPRRGRGAAGDGDEGPRKHAQAPSHAPHPLHGGADDTTGERPRRRARRSRPRRRARGARSRALDREVGQRNESPVTPGHEASCRGPCNAAAQGGW